MQKRLDYLITNAGLATRSEAKKMIRSGRISSHGHILTDPSEKFEAETLSLCIDGTPVRLRQFVYLMMNKPVGVICATEDRRWKTVCDLLPPEYRPFAPYPVGRLDQDTEGFVLLTNDGELTHMILSPKRHIPKKYYVETEGAVTDLHRTLFACGILLSDGTPTLPAELIVLTSGEHSAAELIIYEGRFLQVKRMFEAVNCRVTFLKRLEIGPLRLDSSLPLGALRELTDREQADLRAAIGK